ncbi:ferredoxin-type protein NapG [Aestuariirhabdus litorea]|uniref:Ferredoxin-type protein NapG n=1 Tax=Aestuariirhabdus litorea TaxID=2528527 RepID=A0A3P3VQR3_9GAMM|nr:ferredoxin-type protein NapG [Aestuariirhabdus litorea]RRJ83869.1 ferredoxin-type protein NapG [Aestuariirhabdus litorea]RWW97092.1 ferredoxin-type protein NapG [Endozoicomonadaceae bacterium GTF-13]
MSRKPDTAKSPSRRQFMADSARAACGVTLAGLGLALYGESSQVSASQALRPPGALPEADFLGACVRCGLCVRDCPWDTLKLGRLLDPVATGTPYFNARAVPCEMCDDIPCVKACPSGALDPALDNIDHSRMGVAVLIDHETCLNMQGLRCDVCYRVCPLINVAITLEIQRNTRTGVHALFVPTVHSDACTGCGKCEHACVLEEAAIKVIPRDLAKGQLGSHYRWGWKEKERAGRSLIPDALDLPDRMPDSGAKP